MDVLYWILKKIGPLFSLCGILLLCVNDMPIAGYIIGGVLAVLCVWFGIVAWRNDVSPAALWFMSDNAIIDNVASSVFIWMFRFFSIGMTIVGLIDTLC